MQTEGFVSAGYVIVRQITRPEYLNGLTTCGHVVSASDYLVPVLPSVPPGWIEALDTPIGRFSGFADAAQGNLLWALEADLARFGMDGTSSTSVSEFLAIAFARGDFHPPSAFANAAAARRFVRLFGPLPADAMLLGLSVRESDVEAIAKADDGRGFPSRLPPCGNEPDPDGELLGYDVYRVEDGELHPWLRDDRAAQVTASGNGPNGRCLMDSIEAALWTARTLGAEGGAWFPWRLTSHALATEGF